MSTSNDLSAVEKRIANLEVVCGEANQEISKAALEVQQAWQGKGLHDISASIQNYARSLSITDNIDGSPCPPLNEAAEILNLQAEGLQSAFTALSYIQSAQGVIDEFGPVSASAETLFRAEANLQDSAAALLVLQDEVSSLLRRHDDLVDLVTDATLRWEKHLGSI